MSDLPYFYGSLSANEADELLKDEPEGTFLVRYSSQKDSPIFPTPYAISWTEVVGYAKRRVWHIRIELRGDRLSLEDEVDSFPNLQQLIKYYSVERYPLSPKCKIPLVNSLQQMAVNVINDNNINVPQTGLKSLYKFK